MGFKHPLATLEERAAVDRAEASFELVRSYAWPVEPLLEGLKPIRAADLAEDDQRRDALEELERDRAAEAVPEFAPITVLRDPEPSEES